MGRDLTTIPIQGCEDLYTVSENGDIHRIGRINKNGTVIKLSKPYKVTHYLQKGRCQVMLSIDGEAKNIRVARLVYSHFKDGLSRRYVVTHKDGNPMNCHVDNLEREVLKSKTK